MGRRPISAPLAVLLVILGFVAVSAMAVGAQEDQETTTTEAVEPEDGSELVETDEPNGQPERQEAEEPEPDDVPLAVWIALGIVLVAAIAWGLVGSDSSEGESEVESAE